MKKSIYLLWLSTLIIFQSCESIDEPTGFIGVLDKTPPSLTITSPPSTQPVKDFIDIQFTVSDFSGIGRVEYKNVNGLFIPGNITHSGNSYNLKLNIRFQDGPADIAITAYDEFENKTTKNYTFTSIPIIKHITISGRSNTGFTIYKSILDKNGVIWFTSLYGLIRLNNISYALNPSGFTLLNRQFRSLAADVSNNIWVDHKRLYTGIVQTLSKYNGSATTDVFDLPQLNYGSSSTHYNHFTIDNYDTVWGCWSSWNPHGWFKYKDGVFSHFLSWDYFSSDVIFNEVAVDHDNNKWFATSKGVKRFDGANWISYDYTNSNLPAANAEIVRVDNQNRVWSLIGGNIAKYENGNWFIYSTFQGGSIESFCMDSNNNLWIGINGYLIQFDGQNEIRKIQIDTPTEIISDLQNNIWVGTGYGIYKVNVDGL